MNAFLQTVVDWLKAEALSIWSKVSGVFTLILNELPDDEVQILHDAVKQFSDDLHAGKTPGEAAANAWAVASNEEGKELSKLGNLLLQAAIEKLSPGA